MTEYDDDLISVTTQTKMLIRIQDDIAPHINKLCKLTNKKRDELIYLFVCADKSCSSVENKVQLYSDLVFEKDYFYSIEYERVKKKFVDSLFVKLYEFSFGRNKYIRKINYLRVLRRMREIYDNRGEKILEYRINQACKNPEQNILETVLFRE